MTTIFKEVVCEDGSIMVVEEQIEYNSQNEDADDDPKTNETQNEIPSAAQEIDEKISEPSELISEKGGEDSTVLTEEKGTSNPRDAPENPESCIIDETNPLEIARIIGIIDEKINATSSADKSDLNKENIEKYPVNAPVPMSLNQDGTVNLEDVRFKCPECDKRYFRSDYLRMHLNLHIREPKFVCESCGDHFLTILDMKTHKETYHVKHTCNNCYRRFDDKLKLRIHKLKNCTKCSKCHLSFTNAGQLRHHLKNHMLRKVGRPRIIKPDQDCGNEK